MDDVTRAVDAILVDNSNLVLLQCTAAYPPAHNELNLRVISTFKELYQKLVIGLSSHDNGIAMDLVAYILGQGYKQQGPLRCRCRATIIQ